MKTSAGGPDRRTAHSHEHADVVLARERSRSDAHLEQERDLLDATLNAGAPAAARSVTGLRERIRRTRDRFDRMRTRERRATDDALTEEHVEEASASAAARSLSEAAFRREEELTIDRADSAKRLWLMLAELDIIATSINAIRLCSCDRPDHDPIFGAANEAQIATERVLDLAGGMLDPEDNRGLFHDTGGSG